jgi:molecular chaperone DnaJ
MAKSDFYKILGVSTTATAKEIKKAYREQARKHHPDTNQGSKKSEARFKKISESYETLSNKKKRADYDRQKTYGPQGGQRSGNRGGGSQYADWANSDDDFNFSGQGRRRSGFGGQDQGSGPTTEEQKYDPNMPARGFDLQFMLDLPLPTVALGGQVPYAYEKYVRCPGCAGTGQSGGKDCPECGGRRQIVTPVTVEVTVPGDLLLQVIAQPHPIFKRKLNDIHAEVRISPILAEHGGPLEVQTLNSVQIIEVEEGTLTGEEHRIPGEGAAILWGKKRGDLVIKFHIIEDD